MRSILSGLVIAGAFSAAPARAEPVEGNWSFGGGIALTTNLQTSLVSNGQTVDTTVQTLTSTPTAAIFVERRIVRNTWFLARLTASYSQNSQGGFMTTDSNGNPAIGKESGTETQLFLRVGVRQQAAVLGPVRFSWFVLLSGGPTYQTQDNSVTNTGMSAFNGEAPPAIATTETRIATQVYDVGVSAGIAIDLALMDNLYLRLSTPLVDVTYARNFEQQTNVTVPVTPSLPSSGSSVLAGLDFSPALELRVTF